MKLTKHIDWSDKWRKKKLNELDKIITVKAPFEDIHKSLKKYLPEGGLDCIEIGCYPGRFMRYFNEEFGYNVSGLEYVEWCRDHADILLKEAGIVATVYHGDILEWDIGKKWDIVCSFGLIEHFTNTAEIMEKHINLLEPDGYLVIEYPNHSGLYGFVMKHINRKSYNIHNQMSLEPTMTYLEENERIEVISASYKGHVSFGNSGLYPWLRKKGKLWYYSIGGMAILIEKIGKHMPNTSFLSPYSLLIAKKR